VRERARASGSDGHSGSVSESPPIKGCSDVPVDRFDQACRFLASLGLPFALYHDTYMNVGFTTFCLLYSIPCEDAPVGR
jgi:hypothetical protein